MKATIKTLFALTLGTMFLSTSVFATMAKKDDTKPGAKKEVKSFNKISVQGNVEIVLVQRNDAGVRYAEENIGSVRVTEQNGLLKITSISHEPAKLIVFANDNLYRVQAADHASVRTEGQFKTKYLQVFLKDNAAAHINSKTESIYTIIEDNADLKLSGITNEHTLKMCKNPRLTIEKFAALKTNIESTEQEELGR